MEVVQDSGFQVNEEHEKALEALLADMQVASDSVKPKWDLPAVVGEYQAIKAWPGYFTRPMKARQEIQLMELASAGGERTPAEALTVSLGTASLVLFKADLPADPEEGRNAILAHIRGEIDIFKPVTADQILDKWKTEEVISEVLIPIGTWAFRVSHVENTSPDQRNEA